MSGASIVIDQGVLSAGVASQSRDDLAASTLVQLSNAVDSGVRSWRWTLLSVPLNSAAVLSSPTDPNPTFTPDVVGTYRIELIVDQGLRGQRDVRTAIVRDSNGLRVPAKGEALESNYVSVDPGGVNPNGYWPDLVGLLDRARTGAGTEGSATSQSLGVVVGSTNTTTMNDNHDLIQAWLDQLGTDGGGELVFSRGIAYVNTASRGPLLYPSNVTVRGINRICSRVIGNSNGAVFAPANGTAFDYTSPGRTLNVKFSNLGIWGTLSASNPIAGSIGLDTSQVSNSVFDFLDLRQVSEGQRHSGVAYSNAFRDIQVSGSTTGFRFANGCNENRIINCRASGVTDGFVFEDGADSAINSITVIGCTVETFVDYAVHVVHNGDAPNDMDVFRFEHCRFTNGPYGFFFEEASTQVLSNFYVGHTLNDGLPDLLEWEIGGNFFSAGNTAVLTAMRSNARNFLMIHGGKIWPVRPGQHNDVELNGNLLVYTNSANQLTVRGNTDTTNGDFSANDITSQTNGPGTERINFVRLRVGGGTLHDAADYAASAGFGTSPTITFPVSSYDARGRVSIQAGAGPSANPTLTLTWASGAWPTPPVVTCSRGDALATVGEWRATSVSTSTVVFTFIGTPVASETYILDFNVIG